MIYKKTLLYDRERQHSFSAVRKIARENSVKSEEINREIQTLITGNVNETLETV
jgi:hypothetical protein